MAGEPTHRFFTLNPRRKSWNMLLRPNLQLRLPIYVLGLTFVFVGLLAAHTYDVYGRLFTLAITESGQPEWFERTLRAQTGDFAWVWGAIGLGYMLAVLATCIVYVHRMVGPIVPIRRQIEALKNGDYGSRIALRSADAFDDVAADLNDLTDLLAEQQQKPEDEGSSLTPS